MIPRKANGGGKTIKNVVQNTKCPDCGSVVPWGWLERICPQCSRRYPSLRQLFIFLVLLLFVAMLQLFAAYTDKRHDIVDLLAAVGQLTAVAIVALYITVLYKRRKSPIMTMVPTTVGGTDSHK